MDSSQQKAFCELLGKTFSIVTGPPGSGKSFMAATFCNMCLEGGEIILAIGTSPAVVRQLFARTIISARNLHISDYLIDRMVCTEGVPETPGSRNLVLDEITKAMNFLSLREETQQALWNHRPLTSKESNYPKIKALFTTFEALHEIVAQEFCPTVLIRHDAGNAHDQFVFAACGKFESTLQRVALFGNQERYPLPPTKHSEQARSHLRGQFRMTTMERLISTGIQPLRLNTQYQMDPDVSHFPFQHSHLDDSTKKPTICDSVSVRRHTARNTPARYLK
jgi:hypothetical protein